MANIKLGVIARLEEVPGPALKRVRDLAFETCQLDCWHVELYTRQNEVAVRDAAAETGVRITALWSGYPGPHEWTIVEGPRTIGFLPEKWRKIRIKALKRAADFAVACNIPAIVTHIGFVPEDPNYPLYRRIVSATRQVAVHCRKRGIELWLETGQETPTTLLRTIQDVAAPNLWINLDPANLIMYGKANPVDALDVFGKYVRGAHAKDGLYPTEGRTLGREVPIGKGKVNFPVLIPKLYELGYKGALTIEREIEGPRQTRDIKRSRKYLRTLITKLCK